MQDFILAPKYCAAAHPLSLADQGTSWTPLTLSTAPLAQPETIKLPHFAQTDLSHPLSLYTDADHPSPF
jgi:hypothetical protein